MTQNLDSQSRLKTELTILILNLTLGPSFASGSFAPGNKIPPFEQNKYTTTNLCLYKSTNSNIQSYMFQTSFASGSFAANNNINPGSLTQKYKYTNTNTQIHTLVPHKYKNTLGPSQLGLGQFCRRVTISRSAIVRNS